MTALEITRCAPVFAQRMALDTCRWLCTSRTGRELITSQTVRLWLKPQCIFSVSRCTLMNQLQQPKPVTLPADIPPEELVTFMAKSGKQEAVQAAKQQQKISDSNIGHKLLSKMGWKVCWSISGSCIVRARPRLARPSLARPGLVMASSNAV